MVRPVGIEPTTIGLKGHCSTTELQAQARKEWKLVSIIDERSACILKGIQALTS
jgi:hypothetical protein